MKSIMIILNEAQHSLVKRASKKMKRPLYECAAVFMAVGARYALGKEMKKHGDEKHETRTEKIRDRKRDVSA